MRELRRGDVPPVPRRLLAHGLDRPRGWCAPRCTPVLHGHAASLAPYCMDTPRPSPRTARTRRVRAEPSGVLCVRAVAVAPPSAPPLTPHRPLRQATRGAARSSTRRSSSPGRCTSPRSTEPTTCPPAPPALPALPAGRPACLESDVASVTRTEHLNPRRIGVLRRPVIGNVTYVRRPVIGNVTYVC